MLGTKLTKAANAILLQYTAPIYILVLAHVLLDEKMTRLGVMTVALCIAGMAIFFFDKLRTYARAKVSLGFLSCCLRYSSSSPRLR